MNDKNILIIYHKEDNDGLFSLGVIYNYLVHENHTNPDNITYPWNSYVVFDHTLTILE
jgi:hypothetical protein